MIIELIIIVLTGGTKKINEREKKRRGKERGGRINYKKKIKVCSYNKSINCKLKTFNKAGDDDELNSQKKKKVSDIFLLP